MKRTKKLVATLALLGLILTSGTTTAVLAANKIITKEAAKNAAFSKAGVTSSQVTALDIDYDDDDDDYGQVYEVEFKANGYKYKYEIDANDGTILKSEKKKLKTKKAEDSSQYIGAASAKSIALSHAKVSASNVTFTKAKLTTEDGVKIYDVEFRTSTTEYEYEINAKTGKILEFSAEPVDGDDD